MHFNINSLAVYAITCLRFETGIEQFHDMLLLHTHTYIHNNNKNLMRGDMLKIFKSTKMTFFGDPVLG